MQRVSCSRLEVRAMLFDSGLALLVLSICRGLDYGPRRIALTYYSQETPAWEHGNLVPLQIDTSQAGLQGQTVPATLTPTSGGHKAPLAPKQGFVGSLNNPRNQHQSPVSGTYALRTPRGKITSIACESCRKRKSKVCTYRVVEMALLRPL